MKHWIRSNRQSLTRALWCGSLGCVLSFLAALNGIPLQQIGYVIETPVSATAEQLQAIFSDLQAQDAPIELGGMELLSVRWDRTSESSQAILYLRSSHIPKPIEVENSLAQLTFPLPDRSLDEESARLLRWARWKKQTLEHSISLLERERDTVGEPDSQLAMETSGDSDLNQNADLDSNRDENETSVAQNDDRALGLPVPSSKGSEDESKSEPFPNSSSPFKMTSVATNSAGGSVYDLEAHLKNDLDAIVKKIMELQSVPVGSSSMAQGVLLTDAIRARPFGNKVAPMQLLGFVVIGATSWIAIGWFYLWLAKEGGSDPNQVSAWLERIGVPQLGSPFPYRARSSEDHHSAKQLTSVLEWALLGVCLWIALRWAMDPNWRALFLDQPLAALARIFTIL